MTSVSGQAALVSVMSTVATRSASIVTPYTRPRSTTLIPSSGSTTSLSASSKSSISGLVPGAPSSASCACVILAPYCLGGRVLPCHPAKERALDPRRVLGHPGEHHGVAKHLIVGLGRVAGTHQFEEFRTDLHRLADRLADQQVGQHRDARLANRAAERVVGHVGHGGLAAGVLEADPQRDLVSAGRVHVMDLGVERLPQALVVRVPVVVQDDLLVQRLDLHHATPKNFCAVLIPSASASTSSGVLSR